jgi:hypothetical protein
MSLQQKLRRHFKDTSPIVHSIINQLSGRAKFWLILKGTIAKLSIIMPVIAKLSIMSLSKMTLSIKILSIMAFSIMTQHNDTQHNDTAQ